jgi:hypothetical protein
MLNNIVTFTSTSVRGNGNTVWLPQDGQPCAFCDKTFDFIRSQIKQTGLITQRAAAGNDRLTGVPTNVKALFLFVQTMTFSANEVAVLRAFVSTGGRLVLIGGHETTASQQPGLNTLLAALGSGLRGGQSLGCGRDVLPASSLRAHQITTGMTEFRPGCAMELSLGSGDKGLIYDATNTVAVIALTSTGGN